MKKVLIIDDEKNIQVSLASILEDEGYQVFFAKDGAEGLEKFKNVNPDAIFLDVWLPGMDGIEVMRRILQDDPTRIIIMISGHSSISSAVSALKGGAYDFLEKPLSLDKVVFSLKRGLEYRQVLEENLKLKSILQQSQANGDAAARAVKAHENTGVVEIPIQDPAILCRQKTIREEKIFYGIGLHSGEKTGMAISPLPPGKGIRFENLSQDGYIPARIEYLDSTGFATSIRKDHLEARTIEHFMSVLHAFGITNLAVKINKEVPIDDGSALGFCDLIRESGVLEQDDGIPEIIVRETLLIGDEGPDGKYIKVEPADNLIIRYTCIYPEPLGRQSYEFVLRSPQSFIEEIAPARTYGFTQEINRLMDMGLAGGGRINNFILIDNGRIINTELRFPEELARHKILDIMGDFYLTGHPIRARITAQKTGHTENAAMVNLIKEKYVKKQNGHPQT